MRFGKLISVLNYCLFDRSREPEICLQSREKDKRAMKAPEKLLGPQLSQKVYQKYSANMIIRVGPDMHLMLWRSEDMMSWLITHKVFTPNQRQDCH